MFGPFHVSNHRAICSRLSGSPELFQSLMNIVCAGLNHETAPVSMRERFAVGERDLATVLNDVRAIDGLEGAVVLSMHLIIVSFATAFPAVQNVSNHR